MTETSLYFGPQRELAGTYHAVTGPAPDRAVLFCPPFAEEAKTRVFVEAARTFAQAGIPSLRFDYFGTGDSAGHFRDFSPARAVADIQTASANLRELSGATRLVLLGLRLGGAFALAAAPGTADELILWQPVLDGKSFFDLTIKRQLLRRQLIGAARADARSDDIIDLDGFPLSRAAAEQLRSLDGLALAHTFTGPVRLLQISHADALSREFQPLDAALGPRLSAASVLCEPFWNRIDLTDTSPVIRRTLDWLR